MATGAATPALAGAAPSGSGSVFVPDIEIDLRAVQGEAPLLPGRATRVWTYQAQVLKGDPASVQMLPDTYVGPIFRLAQGQRVRIRFTNELPQETIVHWHGLHVPAVVDGHPRFAVGPGQSYLYEFEVRNRAGTYWFHPHPHGLTGGQVYYGLAGLFLISDEEEDAAGLPTGEYDLPLVIQDRTFDNSNQLVYRPNGMMDSMMGFVGDRILVNGRPDQRLSLATRAYRLRLLNGSNSRIYKLAWDDGTPMTVIGTDGGLLERPVEKAYVTLAPAERLDLWLDLSGRPVGTEMTLQSLPFAGAESGGMMGGGMGRGMGGGMGGGMMDGDQTLPNGVSFPVLVLAVEQAEVETRSLPQRLSTIDRYRLEEAVNRKNPRTFRMMMRRMAWTINGRVFEMEGVASDEVVRLNTLEVWDLVNEAGGGAGMGMALPHPIHIHGLQFQVIERQVDPRQAAAWQTVSDGYVDEGWKDVVLLMPGERARVLLKFEDYAGLFLYHCHNLEHEDMGMMRNYRVEGDAV
jgi:FtsP/CotA-like multicopper oxidase with cupredoxin domain